MPPQLEIAVILTTFERPKHLERSLASLALQRGVEGKFEVVVADDGSRDCTRQVFDGITTTVDFPIKFITHAHSGFRVALCRNEGVRASTAPYLLFSDSDCIFPPDHLQSHLMARRPGVVRAGDCFRLDKGATERLDLAAIATGIYRNWVPKCERKRMFKKWFKEQCYQLVRHRAKPKLTGCNIGIAREDLEAVNGFDEMFVGWGCEDDDLAQRLRRAGFRIASALGYTSAYHMWHPTHSTRPKRWTDGPNVKRLRCTDRPIRCQTGLIPISDSTNLASDDPQSTRRPHEDKKRTAA
jgi:glycosyltransferase involved in cell wall biosynthesis